MNPSRGCEQGRKWELMGALAVGCGIQLKCRLHQQPLARNVVPMVVVVSKTDLEWAQKMGT